MTYKIRCAFLTYTIDSSVQISLKCISELLYFLHAKIVKGIYFCTKVCRKSGRRHITHTPAGNRCFRDITPEVCGRYWGNIANATRRKDMPLAYFSKKLNESQKGIMALYLECLAIKEAVEYCQHWLIGRRCTVY